MVTALYAAFYGLFYIFLAFCVIMGRNKMRIPLMDNGNHNMLRRIRAHGNFSEYAPIFIVLLAFMEISAVAPSIYIHILGSIFLLARALHAYGLLHAEKYDENQKLISGLKFRFFGTVLTFLLIATVSLILLITFLL
ncbi:MAG: MAPEG family protein [Pseudomonadota bacterium]